MRQNKRSVTVNSPVISQSPEFDDHKDIINMKCVNLPPFLNEKSEQPLKKEKDIQKLILVIDNDECIGSWGDLSLLYSIFKNEHISEPDIEIFAKIMNDTHCIRPYVKELFETIIDFKKKGIVYKVFMCTAASNIYGWVIFLSKILERWFGQKIYDEIIYGEMIEEWHIFNKSTVRNEIGYIKNMDMIREVISFKYNENPDKYAIVAIDDRPKNIKNGIPIAVSPYNVVINIFQVLKVYFPDKFEYLMGRYELIINNSWEKYLKKPYGYSKYYIDNDIFKGIEIIHKIIFE
jgi:hypothetical protein